jgi:hypothetical protein
MASKTLDGICSTCDEVIDYDGTTENYIMCDGYCRRIFHINCLNITVGTTFWKSFRARKEFLFFCDHCRELQKNFVMRRNFMEAEKSLAGLVEILHTATQDVGMMCRSAVESVNNAASALSEKAAAFSVVNPVFPTKNRRKKPKTATPARRGLTSPVTTASPDESARLASTPKPDEDDEFLTPRPSPKKPATRKGFFGTADGVSQLNAVEEKKLFVISRVHPRTTTENIVEYIKEKTGIDDVRCQLMLAKGRTVSDVDFVSFKISATEADYAVLMKPEIWPAKVLVRDFMQSNRRRGGGGGATGFHRF